MFGCSLEARADTLAPTNRISACLASDVHSCFAFFRQHVDHNVGTQIVHVAVRFMDYFLELSGQVRCFVLFFQIRTDLVQIHVFSMRTTFLLHPLIITHPFGLLIFLGVDSWTFAYPRLNGQSINQIRVVGSPIESVSVPKKEE